MRVMNKLRQPHVWVLLGILVLAAFLRFYKIDAQSLWYDEGNSARIAERSLQLIVEGAAGDIHPPLYYIILKYWRAVFGEGEAALRSFSALCGVLTVLFAYLIGRDLFRRRVGLIAAFLLAIAPFAVYYGQEARMYALLALCAAASTWALFRVLSAKCLVLSKQHLLLWMMYVVATAAGLWTQYAYPFVMIAQGVCVLLIVFAMPSTQNSKRKTQNLLAYAISSAIAIALYAVWVPIAIRQVLGWSVDKPAYELGPAVLDAYRTLVVGRTLPLDQAALPLILFGVLILIGLVAKSEERRIQNAPSLVLRLCLAVLAFLPLALLFVFGLYRDAYLKFLLVCVLPMCVLAARGIDAIGYRLLTNRRKSANSQWQLANFTSALLTLAFALLLLPSLSNLYNNPAYARDDYRGIQRAIAANARPDDAVIFIAPNQWEVYTYYQKDDRNLYPVKYKPATYDEAAQQLEQIAQNHERLFVLYFAERDADPEGWYESWLAMNAYKASEQWAGDIRWSVYSSGRGDWPPAQTFNAQFGDAITLSQVKMRNEAAKAGDVIPFELTWQANAPIDKRYKVFIHIGQPDAPPIAQNDSEPAAGFNPTNTWKAGENALDKRGVWITSGKTVGTFGVYVGMYDPDTGQRLPISHNGQPAGDRLKIGEITIR
jgi:mannosyltransferase